MTKSLIFTSGDTEFLNATRHILKNTNFKEVGATGVFLLNTLNTSETSKQIKILKADDLYIKNKPKIELYSGSVS